MCVDAVRPTEMACNDTCAILHMCVFKVTLADILFINEVFQSSLITVAAAHQNFSYLTMIYNKMH